MFYMCGANARGGGALTSRQVYECICTVTPPLTAAPPPPRRACTHRAANEPRCSQKPTNSMIDTTSRRRKTVKLQSNAENVESTLTWLCLEVSHRLQAFETCVYQKMRRIKWNSNFTPNTRRYLLKLVGKYCELMSTIRYTQKIALFGYLQTED